jgi:hypothetical protein
VPEFARAGDAHGQALMLRGIPSTGKGQGRREAGSGDAEEEAEREELSEGRGHLPAEGERNQAYTQADESSAASPVALGHPAEDGAEERSA